MGLTVGVTGGAGQRGAKRGRKLGQRHKTIKKKAGFFSWGEGRTPAQRRAFFLFPKYFFANKNKTVLQLSENVTKPPVCPSGGGKQNRQNPWFEHTRRGAAQKHRIFKRPRGDNAVSRHVPVAGRSASGTELGRGYGKGSAQRAAFRRRSIKEGRASSRCLSPGPAPKLGTGLAVLRRESEARGRGK